MFRQFAFLGLLLISRVAAGDGLPPVVCPPEHTLMPEESAFLRAHYCMDGDVRDGPFAQLGIKRGNVTTGEYRAGEVLRQKTVRRDGAPFSELEYTDWDKKVVRIRQWKKDGSSEEFHYIGKVRHGAFRKWTAEGVLVLEQHYDDLLEGSSRVWYPDGTPQEEGRYRGGKREGLWTYWHANGKRSGVVTYAADRVVGAYKTWFPSGMVEESGTKDDTGRKVGTWSRWHPNGQKSYEADMVAGQESGVVKEWHEDGHLISVSEYLDGQRDGVSRWYRPDGTVDSEISYKAGKEDGLFLAYFLNGRKQCEYTKSQGERHGQFVEYFPNGRKKEQGAYSHDKKHGLCMQWNEGGKLIREAEYRDGEVVEGTVKFH